MSRIRRATVFLTVLALVGLFASLSFAADFPTRPITLIVPWAPGGGTDIVARGLAGPAGEYLREQINVANLPGGSGAVGLAAGMSAVPDGHTLTVLPVELAFLGELGIYPFGLEAFQPILLVNSDPAALTVRRDDDRWETAADFIDHARRHPGALKIGHSGAGLLWHLAAVAIEQETGVTFTLVPYDGAAPAIKALLGGELDAVTVSVPEVASQVLADNLRMLGVMDARRFPMFPDVPTLQEQGIDVAITTFRGIGAPAGTPREIVDLLHDAFKHALDGQEYKDLMARLGYGIAYRDTDDYAVFFRETADQLKGLIRAAGL